MMSHDDYTTDADSEFDRFDVDKFYNDASSEDDDNSDDEDDYDYAASATQASKQPESAFGASQPRASWLWRIMVLSLIMIVGAGLSAGAYAVLSTQAQELHHANVSIISADGNPSLLCNHLPLGHSLTASFFLPVPGRHIDCL
jgi:uncharacterized NAD(P)/FAD-binding protein YdhS